eukprot:10124926-Lingulodinium_polyedra.AAC.1
MGLGTASLSSNNGRKSPTSSCTKRPATDCFQRPLFEHLPRCGRGVQRRAGARGGSVAEFAARRAREPPDAR